MSDPTPLERPKFDEHAARRVAERHDRDSAPYFAGRAKEIEAFEAAIRNAREATAAVFRIYQGAPGCGKTSLAKHLEHTCELRALVVSFTHDETFDREALARKVKNQVISRNKISKSLAAIGEFAATTLRNQELSREAQEEFARNRIKDECLVVHIDEAHAMPDSFKLLLVGLHVQRPGVPCVVLLTGLGHTAEVVTGHAGLSRIAGDTVVQMGGMSKGECAESTWKMLRELRPHGPDEQKARLAELTAELSFGWPQHLNIAQKSLCEELLRTNGQAEPVDTRRMARKTAARRAEYYERRIQHPPLYRYPTLTHRMLAGIARNQNIRNKNDLWEVCADIIEKHGPKGRFPMDPAEGREFGEAFGQKGITTEHGGRIQLAIPSMGDWAAQAVQEAVGAPQAPQPPAVPDSGADDPPGPALV